MFSFLCIITVAILISAVADTDHQGPDGKLRVRQPAEVLMRYLRNQLLQSKDPMIDLEMRILEAEEKLQDISKDFCQAKPVADQCRFEIQGLEKEIAAAREKLAKARREDGYVFSPLPSSPPLPSTFRARR